MSQAVSRTPANVARHDLSARQAMTAAWLSMVVVLALDLMDGRLGPLYSVGFVLIVITLPLSVDVRSLFPTGVLPPALLFGSLLLICLVAPDAIQVEGMAKDPSVFARLIAGVIDHGMTLVVGHGLALVIIGIRIVTDPDR